MGRYWMPLRRNFRASGQFLVVFEAIRELMEPPAPRKKHRIGFVNPRTHPLRLFEQPDDFPKAARAQTTALGRQLTRGQQRQAGEVATVPDSLPPSVLSPIMPVLFGM
jgi:hypothetical protein